MFSKEKHPEVSMSDYGLHIQINQIAICLYENGNNSNESGSLPLRVTRFPCLISRQRTSVMRGGSVYDEPISETR